MKLNLDNFLATLFEPQSLICFAPDANGYRVYESPAPRDVFFSINSLLPIDTQPTKVWHAESMPRRADANVACLQNVLLELDEMALDEQIRYVRTALPVTSIVHSGGKSHHFIISLDKPLPDLASYA